MKKIIYILIAIISASFLACENNKIINEETVSEINPNNLYAKTQFNFDMKDFAMAVSKAVNTNKSFRKLIKEEAMKQFDGDYDILLSNIIEKSVAHNDVDEGINTPNKVKANFRVKDLLEDAFYTLNKENKLESTRAKTIVKRMDSRQLTAASSSALIDELSEEYPNLQISVPIHAEDLEDESYIPPVVFIPDEADESTTEYLPVFDEDGITMIDAVDEPDDAVLVIGMNERILLVTEDVTPPTPTNLTAQVKEYGIYLNWMMPTETDATNTSGYRIYRAIGNDLSYTLLGSVKGYSNREYIDINVTNNVTYRYYVIAYNDYQTSEKSNYINITPSRPNAPISFSVDPEALNIIKLSWTFAPEEYNGKVNIYKRQMGISISYGSPIASLQMPADEYFDTSITPGQKVEYKIERETATGKSLIKYDFIHVPYRDISKNSKVFIRKLKFSDIGKIESWWKGAPEFSIKALGINGNSTVEIGNFFIRLKNRDNNSWTTVPNNKGTVTYNWKPENSRWYDCISFYFVEWDGGGTIFNPWDNLTLMGQKFAKVYETDKTSKEVKGALEMLEVTGELIKELYQEGDEKIGYVHLNYYDNPKGEYSTNSAEKGGVLTVQFSDVE